MNSENIKKLKKVELHLHLDGSLSFESAEKLSNLNPGELKEKMVASNKCENLSEYLTKFSFPLSLMQTKKNLTLVAKDLVHYLEKENVVYAEIRFAPMFHTKQGLSFDEIIKAVLKGLKSQKVKTNLILCLIRGMDEVNNLETIITAKKYLNKGVCAIDLAGDEAKYPTKDFAKFFQIAAKKGIPFTIHAGEAGQANEIKTAIELGAKRIGHGIHCIEDENVINLIKEKNILLEICPTSNVQTNSIKNYQSHPIKKLYDMNIPLNINTDNKTVSNITLNEEYEKLYKTFDFSVEDFKKINLVAINHAFISEKELKKLLEKLK